jgi:hypothetical protein
MKKVDVLLEFDAVTSFHQDEVGARAALAKLHSHSLERFVTDEEIFKGIEYSYEKCKVDPRDNRFPVLKRNSCHQTTRTSRPARTRRATSF